MLLGLAGLGLDRANPKPFSLSCKRVGPCADCAGWVIENPLVWVAAAVFASWGRARFIVCLEVAAKHGEIANMIVDVW